MINAPSAQAAFAVPGTLPASTMEGRMLCASGLAYSISVAIDSQCNYKIPQTASFYAGAGYIAAPVTIQNGDAACTIGQNQDGIIIAFRGTMYSSPTQWLTELMLGAKKGENIPGKVHRGFYDNVRRIDKEIHSYFENNPGRDIYITGHGNGAGMAAIAAYVLHENYNLTAKGVFLFAPPNPGNSEFAGAYNLRFPDTYSYVNNFDIVPMLPPSTTAAEELEVCIRNTKFLSDEEKILMIALLTKNAFFGYTHVGNNVQFIEAAGHRKYRIEPLTASVRKQKQWPAIKTIFSSLNFSSFVAAHSYMFEGGYMNALCPTITYPRFTSIN